MFPPANSALRSPHPGFVQIQLMLSWLVRALWKTRLVRERLPEQVGIARIATYSSLLQKSWKAAGRFPRFFSDLVFANTSNQSMLQQTMPQRYRSPGKTNHVLVRRI